MDVAKIKALLLASVGNPESGVLSDCADAMALAVVDACRCDKDCCKKEVKSFSPIAETRVTKAIETR